MTGGAGQAGRIDAAVMGETRAAPWSLDVEDRAMKAWIALDRFTGLSAAEIRQERRALLEMAEMIERALHATRDRAEDDAMVSEWEAGRA